LPATAGNLPVGAEVKFNFPETAAAGYELQRYLLSPKVMLPEDPQLPEQLVSRNEVIIPST